MHLAKPPHQVRFPEHSKRWRTDEGLDVFGVAGHVKVFAGSERQPQSIGVLLEVEETLNSTGQTVNVLEQEQAHVRRGSHLGGDGCGQLPTGEHVVFGKRFDQRDLFRDFGPKAVHNFVQLLQRVRLQ